MKIIAFTGMPCSGKSEAVKIVIKMNIPVVSMGEMVIEEVTSRGLPLDDKHVGGIADQMRKEHGKDIWAKRTLKKISSFDKLNFIVIDGIRNIEEIDTFKNELGKDFVVIAITSLDGTRQKRYLSRGREDDGLDTRDLEERDKREIGWGLEIVIASADIIVQNEGEIHELQHEIQKILDKFETK